MAAWREVASFERTSPRCLPEEPSMSVLARDVAQKTARAHPSIQSEEFENGCSDSVNSDYDASCSDVSGTVPIIFLARKRLLERLCMLFAYPYYYNSTVF